VEVVEEEQLVDHFQVVQVVDQEVEQVDNKIVVLIQVDQELLIKVLQVGLTQ
jgi:hypothetical protein